MSTWLPAVTALLGVGVGAVVQYCAARSLRRTGQLEELRSRAYVDFVRAVAAMSAGGVQETAGNAVADLTDAKVRIALYGSEGVIRTLATFCETEQRLSSQSARDAFLLLAVAMRADATAPQAAARSTHELATILYGYEVTSLPKVEV
jgi:hypothetical protein